MTTGVDNFEMYEIDLQRMQWNKIEQSKPIVQNMGTKPLYIINQAKRKFDLYSFSGMVPLQRINSGVRVCPPDLFSYDSKEDQWQRVINANSMQLEGRKHFAMSECDGRIYISGGMDHSQKMLDRIISYDIESGEWQDYKQVR